jgi:hypothetical protein
MTLRCGHSDHPMMGKQGHYLHIPAFRNDIRGHNEQEEVTEHSFLVIGCLRAGFEELLPGGEDCILKILEADTPNHTKQRNPREAILPITVAVAPRDESSWWLPISTLEDLPHVLRESQFLAQHVGYPSLLYKKDTTNPFLFLFSAIKEHREWLMHVVQANFRGGLIIRNPPCFPDARRSQITVPRMLVTFCRHIGSTFQIMEIQEAEHCPHHRTTVRELLMPLKGWTDVHQIGDLPCHLQLSPFLQAQAASRFLSYRTGSVGPTLFARARLPEHKRTAGGLNHPKHRTHR